MVRIPKMAGRHLPIWPLTPGRECYDIIPLDGAINTFTASTYNTLWSTLPKTLFAGFD